MNRFFRRLDVPERYNISFGGAWHPARAWLIGQLQGRRISVEVVGYHWPNGEVGLEEMVSIFRKSRINLKLCNSTVAGCSLLGFVAIALINRYRSSKNIEQIKARPFETGGCGAFQLSYYVEGLESLFKTSEEIATFLDADDLLRKVDFYLQVEAERETIVRASYRLTVQDHTFRRRFEDTFRRMRLA